eukprot:Anaeramoba_flamelloidesa569129_25.p3 GENE.a569129_25~~a569129_25.p3  ORF type:complete len:108 (+),score=19.15 a569129_25:1397-1720(+)
MKIISKILVAGILSLGVASANDVMQTAMSKMDTGLNMIQKGFMHNKEELIREGVAMLKSGNKMFSDEKTIAMYLPSDKKHMVNVAVNQSKRISLDATEHKKKNKKKK